MLVTCADLAGRLGAGGRGDPGEFRDVVALADGSRPMRDVLADAGRTPGPQALRRLRTTVSTPAFPQLLACLAE